MEIKKVSQVAKSHGIKALVYGVAGAGKTTLATTTPEPDNTLIVSAESGLLSIKDSDIDVTVISSIADMEHVYNYLRGEHKYTWLIVDSLSEIAEVLLAEEKKTPNDKGKIDIRGAYGNLAERMIGLCKAFRDLPGVNVVFTAKQHIKQDDFGPSMCMPMFPGAKLAQELPYLFDLVMCLRVHETEEGEIRRALQCQLTEDYYCKDRSNMLDMYEQADLSVIYNKINGGK